MINFEYINKYCKDDISLIENYEKATKDKKQTWHCHHRLETELGLTADELIEQGKYFNVPASELIFLTPTEHARLHNKGENNAMYGKRGEDAPFYNKHHSEETRKKKSESMKGENNPMYGKRGKDHPRYEKRHSEETKQKQSKNSAFIGKHPVWMNNGIIRVRPTTQDGIDHYLSLGYHFGKKLNVYITKNIT